MLKGVIPVVALPFTEGGKMDENSFRQLSKWLAKLDIPGAMLFGIASEFYKLTDQEKSIIQKEFIRLMKSQGKTCVVSVTDHSWEVAVNTAQSAQKDGAHIMFHDVPWRDQILDHPLVIQDGHLVLSKRPGLGVDLIEDVMEAHPGIREARAGFYV
ncbi:hypothetical protein [Bacillus sp. SD088]|uniref:hypothetical protein n=1 Tax=Bacillus sp. SD088 TaxID=2782012 RepID=UPI001A95B12A|nr:hypothetical protein [Bacillus sp. SD088]MBO0991496.1 hypothetical protein [Bacillus sp. SD088]